MEMTRYVFNSSNLLKKLLLSASVWLISSFS